VTPPGPLPEVPAGDEARSPGVFQVSASAVDELVPGERQEAREDHDPEWHSHEPAPFVAVASKWGHFLNQPTDFDAGLFGVKRGLIKGLFFAVGTKLSFLRAKVPLLEKLYYGLRNPVYASRQRRVRQVLKEEFGLHCPVEFIGHHFAHACSAYYTSTFDDALVVTMDASGDGCSSQVYEVTGGIWQKLHQVASFDSLGSYYAYATHLCGFTAGRHEGKVTGLAAHGKDTYKDILYQFIRYQDGTMRNIGNAWYTAAVEKMKAAFSK